jgi:aminoglycoside 6'-N-acetyltransferase Ib
MERQNDAHRMLSPPVPTASAVFSFRPLALSDVAELHAWLQRPHVAEWWHDAGTLQELMEEYAASIAQQAPSRPYFALADGAPIGYIQWYQPTAFHHEGWWLDEHDPGVRGIDQFLAFPEHLNRGIGSAMIRAFVAELFSDPHVTRIQTDPDRTNARAIRCYEKAGFMAAGEVETPDGRALLMYCDR